MGKFDPDQMVRIRPYPKVVFFYPSVLLAGIVSAMALFGFPIEEHSWLNLLFLGFFGFNVFIFAFDSSVLMTIIIGIVVVLGGIILALLQWLTPLGDAVMSIRPGMNDHFYYFFFVLFVIVYLLVYIRTRFNYFDISHNELFHKTGLLSDTQRINAPNISYKREIADVFEYWLLGAGRIKIMPRDHEPFVVETVIGVNKIDQRLGEILSKMEVTWDSPVAPPQQQG